MRWRRIYADYAATTPLSSCVERYMRRAGRAWANPSAIHTEGVEARAVLEKERGRVAQVLGVRPSEVYFVSGGTEANTTIIHGVIESRRAEGIEYAHMHVITTTIEHGSVREAMRSLESRGVRVSYIAPDARGVVSADEVMRALVPETVLVSVMYANNEIGTIQPVSKIGAALRAMRSQTLSVYPVFHTDASQAPLWLSCVLEGLRVDAMTIDAHKMEGPRGVGALVVRSHVKWAPLLRGGGQERGKRATTESVALIAGCAEALVRADRDKEARSRAVAQRRDDIIRLLDGVEGVIVNGSLKDRLPNNLNVSVLPLRDAELAVLELDARGIACSTKSSCLSGEEESYVVKALGGDPRRAQTTLRFSLSPRTTSREAHVIASEIIRLTTLQRLCR